MAFSLSSKSINAHGFTLVEIAVVVSILAISFGTGIAAYNRFNNKQTLIRATQAVESELRNIQKKADSGDRGTCSGELGGYQVNVVATTASHRLEYHVICDGTPVSVGTFSLSTAYGDRVSFTAASSFVIQPLSQGITGGPITIGLSHSSLSGTPASIVIGSSGAISCQVDGRSC